MSEDLIPWSKDYLLSWDDFQGNPDPAYAKELENFRGKVSCRIPYQCKWGFDNEQPKIEIQCLSVEVNCFFNKNLSWVRDDLFNESKEYQNEVLKHEQGHFDLAEEYARIIQKRMAKRLNRKFAVQGKNKDEQLKNLQNTMDSIGARHFSILEKEWKTADKKYDEETNHGKIKSVQALWDARFEKLRENN